jgi:hypothetical protein
MAPGANTPLCKKCTGGSAEARLANKIASVSSPRIFKLLTAIVMIQTSNFSLTLGKGRGGFVRCASKGLTPAPPPGLNTCTNWLSKSILNQ